MSSFTELELLVCDDQMEGLSQTEMGFSAIESVDKWEPLTDDGSETIRITGEIQDTADHHWYTIHTTDDVAADVAAGRDDYNFQVKMELGEDGYQFIVYRDDYVPSAAECGGSEGYTEYSDFWWDSEHPELADPRACGPVEGELNHCEDMSRTYYIEVFRVGPSDCPYYQLAIANGPVELVTLEGSEDTGS